jgi:dienelactone hydrolase
MLTRLMLLGLTCMFLGSCSSTTSGLSIPTTAPNGALEQIPATVFKPDGPGSFPAVVIMHDCSGLGPTSSGAPSRWARVLVRWGYVVLLPDSFTTRGHAGGVCSDPSPSRAEVSPARRVRDAYAALAYLRTLSYVDGQRVGLMGGSHGGTTTLAAMATSPSDVELFARDRQMGFVAAVALYPGCTIRLGSGLTGAAGVYKPMAPVRILIGEQDDWTPAAPCRKLTEAAEEAGYPVTIKVYPGVHHAFDSDKPVRYVATRVNANAPGGRGATTGGDSQAWADSMREVGAFFGQYLMHSRRP